MLCCLDWYLCVWGGGGEEEGGSLRWDMPGHKAQGGMEGKGGGGGGREQSLVEISCTIVLCMADRDIHV